jgi:hypothetical protein
MGSANLDPTSRLLTSDKWPVYAGIYALLCSTIALILLWPFASLLGKSLIFDRIIHPAIAIIPVAPIASVIWWGVIERRGSYRYIMGGCVGFLTALLTNICWLLVLAIKFGYIGLVGVIFFVITLAVSGVVGFVTNLPLMYLRRRLDNRIPEKEHGQ